MKFTELVDIDELRRLCENFTSLTGMVTAILDLEGNILIATGWQDICTCFHRVNPITAARCRESDTILAGELKKSEKVHIYKCKNGLVDIAVPIKVHGIHVANFFTGQIFLESPDKEFFIRQAEEFDFDKNAYLEALSKVPILSSDKVNAAMAFFAHLGQMFGEMGLARKELEEANREIRKEALRFSDSEKRFRILVNTIPDLIWLKDAEGVYLSCNLVFERFFGAKEAEIVGKTDYDFVDKELADFFRENDRKAMLAGKPSSNEEWVTFADDGHRALLYTTKMPMHAADGKLIGVLGIGRDITELRQAEQDRATLENQLHQSQKIESIGQLAGGVAHDFNNMLGVILGQTEMAMMHPDPSKTFSPHLQEIRTAAKRSAEITRQLLTFARKQVISPKILDLNKTVAGMLKMLQRLIGENILLSWQPGTDLCPVKIDPTQIDQILVNLCINARDAISDIGKISIKTTNLAFDENKEGCQTAIPPGEYVVLSIRDDGCGIDKDTLSHLFEPFFTTKGVGQGTGLGLATVYGAVKQNDGFIDAFSQPGQGTVFNIYLPCAHSTAGIEEEETNKSVHHGNETVLLAEDDKMLLQMTTTMLEMNGYTVLAADTPGLAQTLAKEHPGPIHLLISDVIMPEMNGKELSMALHPIRPEMKVIFMSGYSSDIIASQGVIEKGVHLLQKPISFEELTTKVRAVLDSD